MVYSFRVICTHGIFLLQMETVFETSNKPAFYDEVTRLFLQDFIYDYETLQFGYRCFDKNSC